MSPAASQRVVGGGDRSSEPMPAKRARQLVGSSSPPEVNTWVRLLAGTSSRKKVDRAAAATGALVTAVKHDEGTAVVIRPNPLVLLHGFTGPAMLRLVVPFKRLRPYAGGDISQLKMLEEELNKSVQAAAKQKEPADASEAEDLCDTEEQEPPPEPSLHEPQAQSRNAATLEQTESPVEPSTPRRRAEPVLAQPERAMDVHTPQRASRREAKRETNIRLQEFTRAVSEAFGCGTSKQSDRMSRQQLTWKLCIGDAFSWKEFEHFMVKLDQRNKIMVQDEVIFLIV